jgi:hypothetical protein
MKNIYFICLLIILSINSNAQNLDPLWDIWQYEHGATIEEFINNYGETNYYVTWASSAGTPWTHDIYNKIVAFDTNGAIYTVKSDTKYISTWEAQEPISTAINPANNYIFSIWEDGSDSNIPDEAVNVHAQIHKPDGSIIKDNFLLAGGANAQHSPVVTHLKNNFFAIYCDDDVPGGTAIFANSYNDQTGTETGFYGISPINEYHWWPTVASTNDGSAALLAWIHDTEIVAGCIVKANGSNISVLPYNDYLSNIQFVNQQVNWLENISKFVIIAKTLNQNKSKLCLIDKNGNKLLEKEVPGAVLQEARPAIKWDAATQSYIYLYPTGTNDINVLQISENLIRFDHKINGNQDPELSWLQWKKTGTWSTFVTDDTGKDSWNGKYIALFAWGDYDTDEELMATVYIDTDIFAQSGTSETVLSYDDFENGWGNFSDGGSDCSMYTGTAYAHQGTKAVQIRDDSGDQSSFEHTNGIDITMYDKLKVEFWFKAKSMENGEDFWVMYWDGYNWNDIGIYAKGNDFVNGKYYFKSILLDRNDIDFVNNMKIRFQCDASGNYDFVYIDQVKIIGIIGGAGLKSSKVIGSNITKNNKTTNKLLNEDIQEGKITIFPNPVTNGTFKLKTEGFSSMVQIRVFTLQGSLIYNQNVENSGIIQISNIPFTSNEMYIINVSDDKQSLSNRFIVK